MDIQMENGGQVILLTGRINSSNAGEVEEWLFQSLDINQPKPPVFDVSALEYISSAGLRVLMKVRKRYEEKLVIRGASLPVYEIFETTGFIDLFDVKKTLRNISVDGCEVLGKGFFGTVYRLDEDTIVKVYHSADAVERIQNEKKMAKAAFINGIPTAISYDMVKVGEAYGSVFELIRSKTFNDLIIEHPEHADEYIRRYVDFIKQVHHTEMEEGLLPSSKEKFAGYLDKIRQFLNESQFPALKEMLKEIPESLHLVHGDFQMKNVMLMDEEPMLIDMDTLSTGQAEFDLAALYVTYQMFEEDDPDNSMDFLGITNDMAKYIWSQIMKQYYEDMDETERGKKEIEIRLLASIWFLYVVSMMEVSDPLREIRIRHTCVHIDEWMEKWR